LLDSTGFMIGQFLRRIARAAALGVSGLALVAPADGSAAGAPDSSSVGAYLARVGNCGSCHTRPGGDPLAGGVAFETPFGVIYSTNITPHPEMGLGRWRADDFLAAMKRGVRPNGEHLYPVFPYTHFAKVSDEDLMALWEYLRDTPASAVANPVNDVAFPFSQRPLLAIWKWLFLSPEPFQPSAAQTPEWNRGAYLVEGLAHCSACHSPRNLLGAETTSAAFSGGLLTHPVGEDGLLRRWSAPDITHSNRGLANWRPADLIAYLGQGRNRFLDSTGPMNAVIFNSTQYLSSPDLQAIATYLFSLPGSPPEPVTDAEVTTLGRGRTVYNLHCGTCHLPTGEGDPEMGPRLNRGSLIVQSKDPASLINTILYGPELDDHHLTPRWLKPMDAFQYLLDDEEVAAVATYVRQSWDNRSERVTAEQVAQQR
jgi:mono/diheme cytochrome c family protein